jgi:saccharopine dehydrogenase-like NADP-dependent oxidoreductase
MKKLILFGAGKSATCLIDYLIEQAPKYKWQITVIDADPLLARAKVGKTVHVAVETYDIGNDEARGASIADADLVISLLPAALHILVAKDCLRHKKSLLTASYISPDIRELEKDIERAGVLFMSEMGLDPGIDHMSAMKILDSIRRKGGEVLSFKGYCGALIAPECDDNPWRYKFSWNPRSVVLAGSAGARYRINGKDMAVPYEKLFSDYKAVEIPGIGKMAYYPNRDSLHYASLYQMENVPTILRATLRYPEFCEGWQALISLGLTDPGKTTDTDKLTFSDWTLQSSGGTRHGNPEEKLAAFLHTSSRSRLMRQFKFLGLLDSETIALGKKTNADVLLQVLIEKLRMKPSDRDMIVMLHEMEFERKSIKTKLNSHLIVLGEDNLRTAIAKTVGLPLGILAKLLLTGKVQLTGLHIPVMPEVYQPVLKELEEYGIRFEESFS